MVALLLLGCAPQEPAVTLPAPAALVSLHGDSRPLAPPPPPQPPIYRDPGGFDLSQYRLIGLVWGEETPRALVTDPRGRTTTLTLGSPLGRSGGRVAAIGAEGVELVEELRTTSGEVTVLTHTLTLH